MNRRASAAAFVGGVLLGAVALYAYSRMEEGIGPKLQRECVSLVDTVLNQDKGVSRIDLTSELKSRGVTTPEFPTYPTFNPASNADWQRWGRLQEEYIAAKKAYDARWEEIKRTAVYDAAWEATFAQKRGKAITDCVYERARREGVKAR